MRAKLLCVVALAWVVIAVGSARATTPAAALSTPAIRAAVSTTVMPVNAATNFVPISPCRIIDTRLPGAGGAVQPSTVRGFRVSGTDGFQYQGGHVAGCGIPPNASAVFVTITAITPSRSGYLRAWSSAEGEPISSLLQFTAGHSNAGASIVSLGHGKLRMNVIARTTSPVHITADVTAFYVKVMQMHQLSDGSTTGNGRMTSEGQYYDYWYAYEGRNEGGCVAVGVPDDPNLVMHSGPRLEWFQDRRDPYLGSADIRNVGFQIVAVC